MHTLVYMHFDYLRLYNIFASFKDHDINEFHPKVSKE